MDHKPDNRSPPVQELEISGDGLGRNPNDIIKDQDQVKLDLNSSKKCDQMH